VVEVLKLTLSAGFKDFARDNEELNLLNEIYSNSCIGEEDPITVKIDFNVILIEGE
jgi:hypothetical protein